MDKIREKNRLKKNTIQSEHSGWNFQNKPRLEQDEIYSGLFYFLNWNETCQLFHTEHDEIDNFNPIPSRYILTRPTPNY